MIYLEVVQLKARIVKVVEFFYRDCLKNDSN